MASERTPARRAITGLATFLLVLGVTAGASAAEPTAADRETARALMAEGRSKRDAGDLEGALRAFRGADALMHVPTTGLEVARTHAARGELVEARDVALQVARSEPQAGEPPPFADARKSAAALAAELEGKIGSLTVVVRGKGDVTVDDVPMQPELVGMPRKVNPGHHVVVGRVGEAVVRSEVDVGEGASQTVEVDMARAVAPAKKAHPNWIAIGGFGVAGVGVVLGTITGIASVAQTSSLKERCPNGLCPPSAQGDLDTANALATTSTIAFVIAGVGAAVGVVGLLVAPKHHAEQPATGRRVEPWIGAGSAGLRGEF